MTELPPWSVCRVSENMVVLLRSETGRRMIREKCDSMGLDMEVLQRLIEAELRQVGKQRKRGLRADFDEIFGGISDAGE